MHFPYEITPEGEEVFTFAHSYLRHTKGRWRGDPIILEPWQLRWVSELFKRDPETGRRVYHEALLGLPRKNGKSTLCSVLALYALFVGGAKAYDGGAEVYAAAASKDQARIVFDAAKEMLQASPLIDYAEVYKDVIVVPQTGARFKVLPAGHPERLHGLNPSFVIVDELHAHRDPELYYALKTAFGARLDPLLVSITTAGFDLDTICGEKYRLGQSGDDPRLLFDWLEVAEEDLENPEAWEANNPASWISEEFLLEMGGDPRTGAKGSVPWPVFKRLHLNIWTRAEDDWLPQGAWDDCRNRNAKLVEGETVWIGVDIGRKKDTAAVVVVAPRGEGEEKTYVARAYVFGAEPDPSQPRNDCHFSVPEDAVPLSLVENKVRELGIRYDVAEIVYDPYQFQRSAELLEDEGFEVLEWPQSAQRMVPATEQLFDAIVNEDLEHDGDEVFAKQIAAATVKDTGRGLRLDKKSSRECMDAAIGLAMAHLRARADDVDRPGVMVLS